MADRYQGWTNRATWAVALHINNDSGVHNMARSLAADAWGEATPSQYADRRTNAITILADQLKEFYEEQSESLFTAARIQHLEWIRLLTMDLIEDDMNWREIAGAFIDDAAGK